MSLPVHMLGSMAPKSATSPTTSSSRRSPQATSGRKAAAAKATKTPIPSRRNNASVDDPWDDQVLQAKAGVRHGLLDPSRRLKKQEYAIKLSRPKGWWKRPAWLGVGLFLVLFAFWVLDTLKDDVFGKLVGGNLERHQPAAKLFSVFTTLALVCLLEYIAHERQRQEREATVIASSGAGPGAGIGRSPEDVMDAGGTWSKMQMKSGWDYNDGKQEKSLSRFLSAQEQQLQEGVPDSIFTSIAVPYCIAFGIMAYLLQFHESVSRTDDVKKSAEPSHEDMVGLTGPLSSSSVTRAWQVLGYIWFAAVESYGSLAVATFWSYTNSTLSLHDAESFYGPIIALAQIGAILGSTLVTVNVWNSVTLVILSCLIILLHLVTMNMYSRTYRPARGAHQSQPSSSQYAGGAAGSHPTGNGEDGDDDDDYYDDEEEATASIDGMGGASSSEPTVWSGVYLILKYNYVLLITGASCLYEISLTCLNYQMTLLGWTRFEQTEQQNEISFKQFMGHYGQMVNVSSLLLSFFIFPLLMHRLGLRVTIRLFPTLLLIVNVIAFAVSPGNLAVLFVSVSLLKAMTYSIHDPSKEILYIPTSRAIKFKSKFWIDVVGARLSKAIGSSINTYAGSVENNIRIASSPSLLTAAALWMVCYYVGTDFERLVETRSIVGREKAAVGDDKSVLSEFSIVFDDTSIGQTVGAPQDAGSVDTPTDPQKPALASASKS